MKKKKKRIEKNIAKRILKFKPTKSLPKSKHFYHYIQSGVLVVKINVSKTDVFDCDVTITFKERTQTAVCNKRRYLQGKYGIFFNLFRN